MRSSSSPSASGRAMVDASATLRSSYAWGWRVRSAIVAVAAVQVERTQRGVEATAVRREVRLRHAASMT